MRRGDIDSAGKPPGVHLVHRDRHRTDELLADRGDDRPLPSRRYTIRAMQGVALVDP